MRIIVRYKNIVEGTFISRPNRFIAYVKINDTGKTEMCHVKNTGRCRELLIPGEAEVYLEDCGRDSEEGLKKRKTRYSVIGVKKGDYIINMDSQAPNKAVYEWLISGRFNKEVSNVKMEYSYGKSRIDAFFMLKGKKCLMEVKGVTLEDNGVVRFPDAPTQRGVKHIHELIHALEEGYESYIVFVIQMRGVKYFEPNDVMDKEFGDALREAQLKGVKILAVDCAVEPGAMEINDYVEVRTGI